MRAILKKLSTTRFSKKKEIENVPRKILFDIIYLSRLPVLDSAETIEIIKKYLETGNFSVFEVFHLFNVNTRSVE